ncbi:hypothetical protein AZE42_10753 [Rhizopogon vesiculosus]|uniref:DUF659 domain-containing protein n=1 Tax=Rhizopogon vesiculosus TaxID=180088 RepID=A0A1J8PFY7_9AGAM|nr:hypothetical protein AZE42_10753 [Rhizopogon vesiculosus]
MRTFCATSLHLETLLSHLSDCNTPSGNQKYNFVCFSPDPEEIELYGTSEAAIDHELEVIFAQKGRRDNSAPCPFELEKCRTGLIAVVKVLRAALHEQPDSAILKKWVKDLSKVAEYHYEAASRQDYVDIPEPPPKGKGGRPVDPRLLHIAIRCYKKTDANKITAFRCIGTAKGCTMACKFKTRIKKILGHATTCEHVPRPLKEELDGGLAADTSSPKVARFNTSTSGNSKPSAMTKRALIQPSVEHISKKARMDQLMSQLDADIVQLFCIGGIHPSKVDLPQWKAMWRHVMPSYEPASASKLEEYLIPTEAAFVRRYQLEHLRTCDNLSMTFDGETTRLPESVYTVHVITPDRFVFLFEGNEVSDESHTRAAKHMFKVLDDIIHVGPPRFSGICSDDTGNTRVARKTVQNKYPWIINMPDPSYRMNLLL